MKLGYTYQNSCNEYYFLRKKKKKGRKNNHLKMPNKTFH